MAVSANLLNNSGKLKLSYDERKSNFNEAFLKNPMLMKKQLSNFSNFQSKFSDIY
jgi:hypothetical protein